MEEHEFDPLAALEAEYAAVLAQNRPPASSPPADGTASSPHHLPGDAESAGSDSEDEDSAAVGGFEGYAPLASSPCHSDSDAERPDRSLDYEEDNPQSEEDTEERPQEEQSSDTQEDAALQEDKRAAIMQSMQQVKLRPPPWAKAANLTDDELVNLVQKQLGLPGKPT
ncbi:mRNA-capping enzyme subunit alpha [Phytophthora cinnamomi]|uniref:mRNA-capping enzyme subunit alpha n=1 Tax=Phytophthora cinnamomi TaxID=4785 RepID=UPI00355AABD3|nr:mRNA-capping enzyme subunit alpha [Phytophthora cinnamomi]